MRYIWHMMAKDYRSIAPDVQMKRLVDRGQFGLRRLNGTNGTSEKKQALPFLFSCNLNRISENAHFSQIAFSFLFFSFGFSTGGGERKSASPAYVCE